MAGYMPGIGSAYFSWTFVWGLDPKRSTNQRLRFQSSVNRCFVDRYNNFEQNRSTRWTPKAEIFNGLVLGGLNKRMGGFKKYQKI